MFRMAVIAPQQMTNMLCLSYNRPYGLHGRSRDEKYAKSRGPRKCHARFLMAADAAYVEIDMHNFRCVLPSKFKTQLTRCMHARGE